MANPVYITDNGTDISNSIDWSTVDLVSVLTKEVSTLKFNVKLGAGQTTPAKTVPKVGDVIKMYDSSGVIFGGTVTETEVTVAGLLFTYQISCTDWSYTLDGTLIAKNYASMDPHDIVLDIVSTVGGTAKGFTTNHVQVGNFLVPSIKFNYEQPTKALEALAKLIGWDWYIDADKDVHFFLGAVDNGIGEGGAAPITIDETSGDIEWNSLDIDVNLQNMKNSVYVIGGLYDKTFTALDAVDVYLTNGQQQVFSLAYAYDKSTLVVELDGVAQSIGTDQQTDPSTVQVLYNDAQRFVRFTAGAPSSGQTVLVYGKARIPILAHASDSVGIATYGEFQDSIIDRQIYSVQEAQQRAQAEILQFGHAVYDVKFNTLTSGCKIGQTIILNSPKLGITNQYLVIKRIEASVFVPGTQGQLEYQIEALGSDNVTFVDIISTLLQQENANTTVDDSTVLEVLLSLAETVKVDDTVALAHESWPYTWG
ncbi:MAG TPA: hypothetical protein VNJ52_04970 [Patescibacteria group bacterium]|nr:hypothetical protein [Patescibacteria group bacterium]